MKLKPLFLLTPYRRGCWDYLKNHPNTRFIKGQYITVDFLDNLIEEENRVWE